MLEQQQEQRENLKQYLAEQIYHKHTLAKYNKEIEREAEKAQMVIFFPQISPFTISIVGKRIE